MVDTEYFLFAILYGLVGTSWGLWSLHMAETWHHRSVLRSKSLNLMYFTQFPLSFLTGIETPAHLLVRDHPFARRRNIPLSIGRVTYLGWMAMFWPARVGWNILGMLIGVLVASTLGLRSANKNQRQKRRGFYLPHRL